MTNEANCFDLLVETCVYIFNNYKKGGVSQFDCLNFLEIKLHFANNIHLFQDIINYNYGGLCYMLFLLEVTRSFF